MLVSIFNPFQVNLCGLQNSEFNELSFTGQENSGRMTNDRGAFLQASYLVFANSLRQEAKLCDIILYVEGRLGTMVGYPAHKLLLISSSKYFKFLFEREELRNYCHFPHLTEDGVLAVLDIVYGRDIRPETDLDNALLAARFMQVESAIDLLTTLKENPSIEQENEPSDVTHHAIFDSQDSSSNHDQKSLGRKVVFDEQRHDKNSDTNTVNHVPNFDDDLSKSLGDSTQGNVVIKQEIEPEYTTLDDVIEDTEMVPMSYDTNCYQALPSNELVDSGTNSSEDLISAKESDKKVTKASLDNHKTKHSGMLKHLICYHSYSFFVCFMFVRLNDALQEKYTQFHLTDTMKD